MKTVADQFAENPCKPPASSGVYGIVGDSLKRADRCIFAAQRKIEWVHVRHEGDCGLRSRGRRPTSPARSLSVLGSCGPGKPAT